MFDAKFNNSTITHIYTFAKDGTTKSSCKYYEKIGYEDIGGFCNHYNKACLGNSCSLLKSKNKKKKVELNFNELKSLFISTYISRIENKDKVFTTALLNKYFKKELKKSFKGLSNIIIPDITDTDIKKELKKIEINENRHFDIRNDRLNKMMFKEIANKE